MRPPSSGGSGNKLKTANTTLDIDAAEPVEQLMAESREPALAGERIATGKAHALTGDRQRLRPRAPCAGGRRFFGAVVTTVHTEK